VSFARSRNSTGGSRTSGVSRAASRNWRGPGVLPLCSRRAAARYNAVIDNRRINHTENRRRWNLPDTGRRAVVAGLARVVAAAVPPADRGGELERQSGDRAAGRAVGGARALARAAGAGDALDGGSGAGRGSRGGHPPLERVLPRGQTLMAVVPIAGGQYRVVRGGEPPPQPPFGSPVTSYTQPSWQLWMVAQLYATQINVRKGGDFLAPNPAQAGLHAFPRGP